MPELSAGILPSPPPAAAAAGAKWNKLHEIDFTALTSTTWTSTHANTDQTVDGYVFRPNALASGNASVGSASGLTGTYSSLNLWWKLAKVANAIDLSGKTYLAFVANVTEPWPWSGWAAIQMGSGNWDPGHDFLRINSASIQVARRQTGTGYGYGGPAMSAAQTSAWLMICTPWLSSLYYQTGVASGALPDPEDPNYLFSYCANIQKNTRGWPWSGGADTDHVGLVYSGHSAGFGIRQLAIYSLEGLSRID